MASAIRVARRLSLAPLIVLIFVLSHCDGGNDVLAMPQGISIYANEIKTIVAQIMWC